MRSNTGIKPVTYGLAFYLMLGTFDALKIAAVGSLLKIAAFIPLVMLISNGYDLRSDLESLLEIAAIWPAIRKKAFLHTFHTLPEIENKRFIRRQLTKFLAGRNIMTPVAISKSNQQMAADYYGVCA